MKISAASVSGSDHPAALPTILIVEDDVLIRAAAAQYLRGTGFTVLEAVDVAQALELLRSQSIAVIFADVKLPGSQNGMDLLRIVQADFPGVKVLLTSGVVKADELILGGVVMLRKPYFLFEVEKHLRALLPATP